MPRFSIASTFVFALSICLLSTVASARTWQSPTERAAIDVRPSAQKSKSTTPRSAPAKAAGTPAKSATVTSAKKTNKPGGRFWSRIMGAFRDVHSAEKKQK